MKTTATLLLAAGLAAAGAAEATEPRAVPQPRLRLERTATGHATRVEPTRQTETAAPTTMPKVVVSDSKLPAAPRREEQPEQPRFSPLHGGPIFTGKLGELPVAIGIWPWRDQFVDDASFKPPQTRVDYELVRIKW